jgi:Trk K+ transport system NAD-binding subunit
LEDLVVEGTIFVASLTRDDDILFMPQKKTLIRVGDQLIILAKKSAIPRVEKLFARRMTGN